jgi:hypothetical protein
MVADYSSIANLLDGYSSQLVKSIYAAWTDKRTANATTKSLAIQEIARRLSDVGLVSAKLSELDESCRAMLFEMGRITDPTVADLLFAGHARGLWIAERPISALIDLGLLLAPKAPHENLLDFSDILNCGDQRLEAVSHAVRGVKEPPLPREALPSVSEKSVTTLYRFDPTRLVGALIHLVEFVGTRGIKLTANGWIAANYLPRLKRELDLDESILSIPLLLNIAQTGGVVRPADGMLRPDSSAKRLLTDPLATTIEWLFSAFVRESDWPDDIPIDNQAVGFDHIRYRSFSDPNPRAFRGSRNVVVSIVRRLDTNGWIDIESLADRALSISPALLYFPKPEHSYDYSYHRRRSEGHKGPKQAYEKAIQREYVRCCLGRTLAAFGLIELGQMGKTPYRFSRPDFDTTDWHQFRDERFITSRSDEQKKPRWSPERCNVAFRVTDLGRQVLRGEQANEKTRNKSCLTVGPDFEIVAPRDKTPPELFLKLDVFARSVGGHGEDPVRRYRLDKASVRRALKVGMDIQQLQTDLETYSGRPLPRNVARTLSDWAKGYGELELFIDRDLLEFSDEKERDEFITNNSGLERVGTRFALADRYNWREHVVDYAEPPGRCISVSDSGQIRVDRDNSDLSIDMELTTFAEPCRKKDHYQISRESITAFDRRSDEILKILRSRTKKPISNKLAVAIRGWRGEISSIAMERLMLLRIDDHGIVDGLFNYKEISDCVAGQLAFGLFVVKSDRVDDLRVALDKLGIEAAKTISVAKPSSLRFSDSPFTDTLKSQPHDRIIDMFGSGLDTEIDPEDYWDGEDSVE